MTTQKSIDIITRKMPRMEVLDDSPALDASIFHVPLISSCR